MDREQKEIGGKKRQMKGEGAEGGIAWIMDDAGGGGDKRLGPGGKLKGMVKYEAGAVNRKRAGARGTRLNRQHRVW